MTERLLQISDQRQRDLMDRYTFKRPCVIGGDSEAVDAHTVWLKVGVQSFCLTGYRDTGEDADWMRLMLAKALATVIEEQKEMK